MVIFISMYFDYDVDLICDFDILDSIGYLTVMSTPP